MRSSTAFSVVLPHTMTSTLTCRAVDDHLFADVIEIRAARSYEPFAGT
jgi:hypothetical protein